MNKIQKFIGFFFIFLGLFFFSLIAPIQAMEEEGTSHEMGLRAAKLYRKKDFSNAALWYVRAANAGDEETRSYLNFLQLNLSGEVPEEQTIQELIHIWEHQDSAHQDANQGFSLYIEGEFPKAAKSLKKASEENHSLAQELYADICLRKLDGKPHPYLEAGMWYLLSAYGGDSDSLSYLNDIIPGILEQGNHKSQMQSIVGCWVMDETLPQLKPIRPDDVNNYLMMQYNRRINKTTAQKLPYFFDRITTSIMFNLTGRAHSVIDDKLLPHAEVLEEATLKTRRCAEEERPNFIKSKQVIPHIHGSIYFDYFQSLDEKLEPDNRPTAKVKSSSPESAENQGTEGTKKDFRSRSSKYLKKPTRWPKISPIYELLLDALQEATKSKTGDDLSKISHRDYPWLWAGIMFWKEKEGKSFDFTSLSEGELISRLTEMSKPISNQDISTICDHIEFKEGPKRVWPEHIDPDHFVYQDYNQRMRKYFTSPLSRKEKVVEIAENHFYERLKEHNLDCSDKKHLEVLKTPFLMYSCHNLRLTNVSSKKTCYEALEEGQRYFVDLEVAVSFSEQFNPKHKFGQSITNLFKKIKKRGIKISGVSEKDGSYL